MRRSSKIQRFIRFVLGYTLLAVLMLYMMGLVATFVMGPFIYLGQPWHGGHNKRFVKMTKRLIDSYDTYLNNAWNLEPYTKCHEEVNPIACGIGNVPYYITFSGQKTAIGLHIIIFYPVKTTFYVGYDLFH